MRQRIEEPVVELFAQVTEALAQATDALLNEDVLLAQAVVTGDAAIDAQTATVEGIVWEEIESQQLAASELRHHVSVLLILPELERSADLAEHIAQRALFHVGADMTPVCRGIVQRMSEVALDMWQTATDAYADGGGPELQEADEELDILHDRLTAEVSTGAMQASVAAQVTLLARFYERIGDHAVNLSRRVASFPRRPSGL